MEINFSVISELLAGKVKKFGIRTKKKQNILQDLLYPWTWNSLGTSHRELRKTFMFTSQERKEI